MIFFTADTHLGHNNIVNLSKRPFRDVNEMDEELIKNWNAIVRPVDTVYHLGDFSFKDPRRYIDRLNGEIHLIFGNHDKESRKKSNVFSGCYELLETEIAGQAIVLCHYAMRVWNASHHGSWHLYGHSHGSLPDDINSLSFDVGVDCWNYKPISFDEVVDVMKNKTFVPVDHHK